MVYLLTAFINTCSLWSYYAQIRLLIGLFIYFIALAYFSPIWGLYVFVRIFIVLLGLAAAHVPHLIASRAISPPQYGKLYAFGTVHPWRRMRSAGVLLFAFKLQHPRG